MDELYTYIKENKTRVWVAVYRNRFKATAIKVGDGRKKNYIEIAIELEEKYEAYCHYTIAKVHLRTKSYTCLVESFNSYLQGMLARLNRKTKRFSKSFAKLRLFLAMVFIQNNSFYLLLNNLPRCQCQ